VPVRLQVRVHPGARRPGLVGRLADGSLKVAVVEPPEGGRANRAVETLVAAALEIQRAQVKVVGGAAARLKQIEIEGLDAEDLERRIVAAFAGTRATRGRKAAHGD
jgi:uncharacterized protein YggU (UPF0235/DUF167 family)